MRSLQRLSPVPPLKATLTALFLALGLLGCDPHPGVIVTYDDLDDATRIRTDTEHDESVFWLETLFVCSGNNICEPDSLSVRVEALRPWFCPVGERNWTTRDSTSFRCEVTEAELLAGSNLENPELQIFLPHTPLWGYRRRGDLFGHEVIAEHISFDLSFDDVRLIAEVGGGVGFRMAGGAARLGATWPAFEELVALIEENGNPSVAVWDPSVSAHYDEESDSTFLRASLPSEEVRPIAAMELSGRCPGRGWCRPRLLSLSFWVGDSTHLSLNLSDVRFLVDSAAWTARFVEFEKSGTMGSVEVEIAPSDLEKMLASAALGYRLDTLAAEFTEGQRAVLQRFMERVPES